MSWHEIEIKKNSLKIKYALLILISGIPGVLCGAYTSSILPNSFSTTLLGFLTLFLSFYSIKQKNLGSSNQNILINKLLLGGPKAKTAIKAYLQNIYSKSISDDVISYAAEKIADLRVSEEGQKGIKAFLNKSNPDWQNDIS